ncbi:MAG: MerR family transcriptional regulator [Eubacteriaceae bacterium]|nr:MerR family transcriptional regulator [Eubacteriaceae bacterium]
MFTIGRLSQISGLSRTAILYYESIGLLTAPARSESNYRLYSNDSAERLEKICAYRDAGVALDDIAQILSHERSSETEILERTLQMLNQKAKEIRQCQERITALLSQATGTKRSVFGTGLNAIKAALAPLGISDGIFLKVHKALEENSPEGHHQLLALLGFSGDEISHIDAEMRKEREDARDDTKKA